MSVPLVFLIANHFADKEHKNVSYWEWSVAHVALCLVSDPGQEQICVKRT